MIAAWIIRALLLVMVGQVALVLCMMLWTRRAPLGRGKRGPA